MLGHRDIVIFWRNADRPLHAGRQALVMGLAALCCLPAALCHASDHEPSAADVSCQAEWHVSESRAALQRHEYLNALTHAQQLLDCDPKHQEARRLFRKARKGFDAEQKRLAEKSRLMAKAAQAEVDGRHEQSLSLWRKAQKEYPGDPAIDEAVARLQERVSRPDVPITSAAALAPAVTPPQQGVTEYRVSAGDVLEVFVYQQQDLSRDVIVRPDGRLSFPLVGDLEAAGRTLTELDAILTTRLKTYIRFPDVSLAIKRFGGIKTIVLGEVRNPGVYIPTGEGRVLQVIAMAGGFTDEAVPKSVMLIRGGLSNPQVAKLNLDRALSKGALEENVSLQPDDIVFIPKGRTVGVLEFMEQFYPTISQVLVGQNIATNFGVKETGGAGSR